MYSDVFCKVYNEFGWNYYPEIFGQMLLVWLERNGVKPQNAMDLACGTGILCRILRSAGITAAGMDLSGGMIAIARENDPEGAYSVADMTTFCPAEHYELVTCTGDALNHIPDLSDIARIFSNVYTYTSPGGYFVFDVLNEHEVSTSEPFEMDFDEHLRVWFQMTRPELRKVHLTIRVYEDEHFAFEEVIRETVHDVSTICNLLENTGFQILRCADRLLEDNLPGTTWFVIARKPEEMV